MKETWKPVKGYEKLYEVSNRGRVKSLSRLIVRKDNRKLNKAGKILSSKPSPSGYVKIILTKEGKIKSKRVHRLVAEVFIKPKQGHLEVNHKNGIKHDNRVSNLEWVCKSDNMLHAYRVNLIPPRKGEDGTNVKLNNSKVLKIRKMLSENGGRCKVIADEFEVTSTTIRNIRDGRTWVDVK